MRRWLRELVNLSSWSAFELEAWAELTPAERKGFMRDSLLSTPGRVPSLSPGKEGKEDKGRSSPLLRAAQRVPPLTLTAFVDREARYLAVHGGPDKEWSARVAAMKLPPAAAGRDVSPSQRGGDGGGDLSAVVGAIEADGTRPSSSASSCRPGSSQFGSRPGSRRPMSGALGIGGLADGLDEGDGGALGAGAHGLSHSESQHTYMRRGGGGGGKGGWGNTWRAGGLQTSSSLPAIPIKSVVLTGPRSQPKAAVIMSVKERKKLQQQQQAPPPPSSQSMSSLMVRVGVSQPPSAAANATEADGGPHVARARIPRRAPLPLVTSAAVTRPPVAGPDERAEGALSLEERHRRKRDLRRQMREQAAELVTFVEVRARATQTPNLSLSRPLPHLDQQATDRTPRL